MEWRGTISAERRSTAWPGAWGCDAPARTAASRPRVRTPPRAATNAGVAAHITAASPGGARYDAALTPEARADIGNGIWLCQNHARLIDNDELAQA